MGVWEYGSVGVWEYGSVGVILLNRQMQHPFFA